GGDSVVERRDCDAVVVDETNVAERRRDLLDVMRLVRIAVVAALRDVGEHVKRKVLLFEKQLEKQAVEAGVDVPVDEAKVIADDVIAIVGEFDRLATALGAAFAFHLAEQELTAHDVELIEARHELGREEE